MKRILNWFYSPSLEGSLRKSINLLLNESNLFQVIPHIFFVVNNLINFRITLQIQTIEKKQTLPFCLMVSTHYENRKRNQSGGRFH